MNHSEIKKWQRQASESKSYNDSITNGSYTPSNDYNSSSESKSNESKSSSSMWWWVIGFAILIVYFGG